MFYQRCSQHHQRGNAVDSVRGSKSVKVRCKCPFVIVPGIHARGPAIGIQTVCAVYGVIVNTSADVLRRLGQQCERHNAMELFVHGRMLLQEQQRYESHQGGNAAI